MHPAGRDSIASFYGGDTTELHGGPGFVWEELDREAVPEDDQKRK
jgi:hypothetical protein